MARSIMIQGTTSDAGKSFIAAALCRIFSQDGYSVAPFKSQNMALNSFITEDGLEMGRAQVMQAEAAGVKPDVRMNPILLKPAGDDGSQVIVSGEVFKTMKAAEYYDYKKKLIPIVQDTYDSLADEHDVVVIEGAGSPAEINLRKDDFVNMGMAKIAASPVLICGDIDRGGVFASLYGTVALLTKEDRRYVKGTIINRFRGDVEILKPGLPDLERLCGVPVLGVIPMLYVDLDDEDSLAPRLNKDGKLAAIDIAVLRLPHLSNFTDFNSLQRFNQVSVRYVDRVSKLGSPDFLIIPGTKNTMADLLWMRQSGFESAVFHLAERGVVIMGICGGYQMLGQELSDPYSVEFGGKINGMGLLPTYTEFALEKTRTRVKGTVCEINGQFSSLGGSQFEGYEIHMGKTDIGVKTDSRAMTGPETRESIDNYAFGANASGSIAITESPAGEFARISPLGDGSESSDGCVCGNVMGTYVHGIFDEGNFAEKLLEHLLNRKGLSLEDVPALNYKEYKNAQYDLLAEGVRNSLDMDAIYRILDEGI